MNEASPITAAGQETDGERPRAPVKGDLTQGPILKTLLLFSIPMLIANVLQTINGSINAIWVGRLIGESALVSVGV